MEIRMEVVMMEMELANPVILDEDFPVKNLRRDGRRTEKETARKHTVALREAKKAERNLREIAKADGKKLDTVYVDGFVMKRKWR